MAFNINPPFHKGSKGGGTTKACLPKAKIAGMSSDAKKKLLMLKSQLAVRERE